MHTFSRTRNGSANVKYIFINTCDMSDIIGGFNSINRQELCTIIDIITFLFPISVSLSSSSLSLSNYS